MKRTAWSLLALVCAGAMAAPSARAAVEARTVQTLRLEAEPVDLTVSPDGQWTFVLTAEGTVLVYSAAGTLEGTVSVGPGFDSLESSTRGDRIYLRSRSGRKVDVVRIEFIRKIDTAGAPFRGPPEAPVEIVVFNDFQ
ncbi:MAG: hypothetical protein Kow0092_07380 [Deferrisomatales bacterium]